MNVPASAGTQQPLILLSEFKLKNMQKLANYGSKVNNKVLRNNVLQYVRKFIFLSIHK